MSKAISDKIYICAKDNIDIIEKCDNKILVLPLRFARDMNEENTFFEVGEMVFLALFPSIPDMETYYKNCIQFSDLLNYIDGNVARRYILFEGDTAEQQLEDRLKKAINSSRQLLDEHKEMDAGVLFFLAIYGYIQQALDIIMILLEYGCIPLIRTTLSFQYVISLLPNFEKTEKYNERFKKTVVVNSLYRAFSARDFIGIPLSKYFELVDKFGIEKKAYDLYDECYANDSSDYMEQCVELIDGFKSFVKSSTSVLNGEVIE